MNDVESLKLVCYENKDKVEFPISKSAAINSNFISNYLDNCQMTKNLTIKLNVDSKILKSVGNYLEHFKDEDNKGKRLHILSEDGISTQFSKWEVDFIRDYELDFVIDLINAAEELDIPGLHNLACARIAEYMMLNSDEDIEKEFKITCNIPEEDHNRITEKQKNN